MDNAKNPLYFHYCSSIPDRPQPCRLKPILDAPPRENFFTDHHGVYRGVSERPKGRADMLEAKKLAEKLRPLKKDYLRESEVLQRKPDIYHKWYEDIEISRTEKFNMAPMQPTVRDSPASCQSGYARAEGFASNFMFEPRYLKYFHRWVDK